MNQVATKEELVEQAAAPARVNDRGPSSEATQIEQSRAIAQVQGALVVARQNPRDTIAASNRMRETCVLKATAERAFYRYRRGGQVVTGPSIHLAAEIARCWGNVDFGVQELRRDDVGGMSEMQAFAWDLETNVRVFSTFIVPHKRDKQGGPTVLVDMRDIYENNANQAARRLRECILRILPTAYKEEAKDICMEVLQKGGGEPIEQRREKLLTAFMGVNVTRRMIEHKMGRAADRLTEFDIGNLAVIYKSITRGETSVGEEFEIDAAAEANEELKRQREQVRESQQASPSPAAENVVPDAERENADKAQQALPEDPPLRKPQDVAPAHQYPGERVGISEATMQRMMTNGGKANSAESFAYWVLDDSIQRNIRHMSPEQRQKWDAWVDQMRDLFAATEPVGDASNDDQAAEELMA